MTEVATPLSLSGFSAAAVEQFGPQLRQLGFEPRQGISTRRRAHRIRWAIPRNCSPVP